MDRQRRAVKRLAERLLQREARVYELTGAATLLAALQRAVRSLIHWYWAPDGGVGGTMIVKVPLWNEQDLDMGLFDKIIRALAFQYVCVWPGPCAILNCFPVFSSCLCLPVCGLSAGLAAWRSF